MENSQITFPPGATIFREGEKTNEMYIIISGKVKIEKATGQGKNLQLAELNPGAMIGEMSLISGQPRSATAVALTEVKLKVIAQDIFTKSAAGVPSWVMCIAKVLIERLRHLNSILKEQLDIDILQAKNKYEEINFSHDFCIEYDEISNPDIIFLKGYLFSNDVAELENFMIKIIRKRKDKISLDFSGVIDVDSNAIEYLIDLIKRLKNSNIQFTMLNVQLIYEKIKTNSIIKNVISSMSPPRKNIPAKTYLIQQGALDNNMYIVKQGRFKIIRNVDGKEVTFAEVGTGDIIGEMTLIAGGKRSASVMAMKPGIVYVITPQDINNNKYNIPQWFLKIIQQLVARIRDTDTILDKMVKNNI